MQCVTRRNFGTARIDTHTCMYMQSEVTTFDLHFPHSCLSIIHSWDTIFNHLQKHTGAFLTPILEEGPGTSQAQVKFLFRINSERLSEQTQCLWITNSVPVEEAVARRYSQMCTQPWRREYLGLNKEVVAVSPACLENFICLPAGKELFQSGAAKGMRNNMYNTWGQKNMVNIRAAEQVLLPWPRQLLLTPGPAHVLSTILPATGSAAPNDAGFVPYQVVSTLGGAEPLLEALLCAVVLPSSSAGLQYHTGQHSCSVKHWAEKGLAQGRNVLI